MMTLFFTEGPVNDFAGAKRADTERYADTGGTAPQIGIYLAPSQFEAAMVSLALSESDIARARLAAAAFFKQL